MLFACTVGVTLSQSVPLVHSRCRSCRVDVARAQSFGSCTVGVGVARAQSVLLVHSRCCSCTVGVARSQLVLVSLVHSRLARAQLVSVSLVHSRCCSCTVGFARAQSVSLVHSRSARAQSVSVSLVHSRCRPCTVGAATANREAEYPPPPSTHTRLPRLHLGRSFTIHSFVPLVRCARVHPWFPRCSSVMAEHLSQSELDYPFKLLEYFNGFRVSKVIFTACELGVFDLLLNSAEPLSSRTVARELGTSPDGMERLLDALVGIDILEVEVADGTALYSSTDVASLYLAKGSAKSLHDMIIYQSQTIYPLWSNMADAVREGRNQNQKTFGLPPEDVFQAIYRSEEEMLKFMGLMNSSWVLDGHDVVTAFNLSGFQTIVDLGGCTGALAREMAQAYPSSSVTVFDLPQVVEAAQQHFSQENQAVAFHTGDFFSGEIPAADLYVLARILHDWPEEKCLKLLRKIYNACKPGGGVLLVEAMLFENRRGPIMAQIFSLNMLVQAEGRERAPSEYSHMLSKTGFHNIQVCRTGKSYDSILAIR
ncbi:acetylserotonin O-methyltransferase-like [Oryzias latipes]|uniref:Acetylserotonin O-methyltransferase n=1 Tax=Oryzias latipes TaxID=8090 RepID=H2MUL9_ORYLA|nr:acetylserotonin O-methyltransferase-like [Oryzias latipes]